MTRPHPWEALYPHGLAWDAPLRIGTVSGLLADAVAAGGGRPAISFAGRTLSYDELDRRVGRVARGLHRAAVRAGEPVALLLRNGPAHPIAFLAVLRLGAVVVHLSPLDPVRAVRRKIADSGAGTLIGSNLVSILPVAREAGAGRLILVDEAAWEAGAPTGEWPSEALRFEDLDGPPVGWPAVDPEVPALLQYTGGTTGQPRAAVLSHANLTSAVSIYAVWNAGVGRGFRPGDRVLCVLPLFHIYALTAVLLRALAGGVEVVLHRRFDAGAVLDAIEHGRCTHLNGVPTMWIGLVDAPGVATRDLSSLRVASSGGAGLPPEVAARFHALTGLWLGGGWGMTETSPAGTNLLPDRPGIAGEIGVPLPGVCLEVVSADDPRRVLPAGEVGELRVRGPNVTRGYWGRPDETAAAFVDGWLLTGDLGRMEPDGRFVLVDRKKDMILSGGFNVYPRVIEDAIHEHPDVVEAAVIGVPDARRGQAARAYVVLRDGAPGLTLAALRDFLSTRLGRHELPTGLDVRAELPRTPVGKLAKRVLMDEAAADAAVGRMEWT